MHIAINIDHNYVPYAMVMLESLFRNGCQDTVVLHLLYESLSAYDIEKLSQYMRRNQGEIRTYKMDSRIFDGFPDLQRWSVETLFRLKIPEVLPEDLHRVLYLDVDMVIEKSLRELYERDFNDKYLIACVNTDGKIEQKEKNITWNRKADIPYFNAGVMLLNLKKIRQRCSFQKYCDIVRNKKGLFPYLDQDLLNYVFGEEAGYVPAEIYNCIISPEMESIPEDAAIYHFGTADKPWLKRGENKYYEIWWKYARSTF